MDMNISTPIHLFLPLNNSHPYKRLLSSFGGVIKLFSFLKVDFKRKTIPIIMMYDYCMTASIGRFFIEFCVKDYFFYKIKRELSDDQYLVYFSIYNNITT